MKPLRPFQVPAAISIALLIMAMVCIREGLLDTLFGVRLPYRFYIVLRVVVSVSACYMTYQSYRVRERAWAIVMALIALLYNPVVPIHFTSMVFRDNEDGTILYGERRASALANHWAWIDLVTALVFTYWSGLVNPERRSPPTDPPT